MLSIKYSTGNHVEINLSKDLIFREEKMTVTNNQVRLLMKLLAKNKTIESASARADMSKNTARKYRDLGKLPSECKKERTWITRKDPFDEASIEIEELLENDEKTEAKTIFAFLQDKYPGKYQEGQLRSLQRKVKAWKITKGAKKEIFFCQKHKPGILGQSDFTHMNKMGITIQHKQFNHMLYHFALTFSNWEFAKICFSESYESLSEGFQSALFYLGKAPKYHQTDNLSSAVKNSSSKKGFTDRYLALLNHYKIEGRKIQPYSPNENGDIEQSHYRLKKDLEQSLILRRSKNFDSIEEYEVFLKKIIKKRNLSRTEKIKEEMDFLKELPIEPLSDFKKIITKVGRSSSIRVMQNTYSVPSRLIGANIEVRVYFDRLELFYGQKKITSIPRIIGKNKHRIDYRHIIHSLVKKPGAFENYKYKPDLFPNSFFRMAYDTLKTKEYLNLLLIASEEGEGKVTEALQFLIQEEKSIEISSIKNLIEEEVNVLPKDNVKTINLKEYDALLKECFYG